MGLLSKSFEPIHEDNPRYHDHDSNSQVPLMSDSIDRDVRSNSFPHSQAHSTPFSMIIEIEARLESEVLIMSFKRQNI